MRSALLKRRWALLAAVLGLALYVGLTAVGNRSATAQVPQIFLDWADGPNNWQPPFYIPPNCASWHEISPVFCNMYHQDGFQDNGDGYVSPCDIIVLNGIVYHVDTAGPTLYLDCSGGGQTTMIVEPVDENWQGGDPALTEWFEVYPNFGLSHTLEYYTDGDNSGGLTVCDFVPVGGTSCHVKRIGCNIRVSRPPTSTEPSTWGSVKGLFNLF